MMGTKTRIFAPLPRDVSLEEPVPKDNFYHAWRRGCASRSSGSLCARSTPGRQAEHRPGGLLQTAVGHVLRGSALRTPAHEGDEEEEGAGRADARRGQAAARHGQGVRFRALGRVNTEILVTAARRNIKRLAAFRDLELCKLAQSKLCRHRRHLQSTRNEVLRGGIVGYTGPVWVFFNRLIALHMADVALAETSTQERVVLRLLVFPSRCRFEPRGEQVVANKRGTGGCRPPRSVALPST